MKKTKKVRMVVFVTPPIESNLAIVATKENRSKGEVVEDALAFYFWEKHGVKDPYHPLQLSIKIIHD